MQAQFDIYKKLLIGLFIFLATHLQAKIPEGYYAPADSTSDAQLKTSLYNIIRKHTQLEYYASATYFKTTDWNPDGYFWDMYSNFKRTVWSGMNREHSLPKSWWSSNPETTVAYSDLHNLYPSDATANTAKSNYPLGEVTGNPVFTNGVVKVGNNGLSGYSGEVFEPADQYKGDFARDYMYLVTCYENYSNDWRSTGTESMLLKNTYPVFNEYAINLLLKWHRLDTVSTKEIDRNDAVYSIQNNRNPFIDHPELAEFIWGKYKGKIWRENGKYPEEEVPFRVFYNDGDEYEKLTVNVNSPQQATCYVINMNGITMKTGNLSADSKLSVSDLRNGIYLLVVYTANTRKTAKFLVTHK